MRTRRLTPRHQVLLPELAVAECLSLQRPWCPQFPNPLTKLPARSTVERITWTALIRQRTLLLHLPLYISSATRPGWSSISCTNRLPCLVCLPLCELSTSVRLGGSPYSHSPFVRHSTTLICIRVLCVLGVALKCRRRRFESCNSSTVVDGNVRLFFSGQKTLN